LFKFNKFLILFILFTGGCTFHTQHTGFVALFDRTISGKTPFSELRNPRYTSAYLFSEKYLVKKSTSTKIETLYFETPGYPLLLDENFDRSLYCKYFITVDSETDLVLSWGFNMGSQDEIRKACRIKVL